MHRGEISVQINKNKDDERLKDYSVTTIVPLIS
jgi:hypothetical protein